jgi:hypothetical protein
MPQRNGKAEVAADVPLRVLKYIGIFPIQIKSTGKNYRE